MQRNANRPQIELDNMINELKTEAHPTVWQEMQRQHETIPQLAKLFKQIPEALTW